MYSTMEMETLQEVNKKADSDLFIGCALLWWFAVLPTVVAYEGNDYLWDSRRYCVISQCN